MKIINNRLFGLNMIRRREFNTKGDLLKYHKQRVKELENYGLSDSTCLTEVTNTELLFNYLYSGLRMYIDMASIIEEINFKTPVIQEAQIAKNSNDLLFEDNPINFNVYQNKYVVIDTPIVFKNAERYSNAKDQQLLANCIWSRKNYWENKNETSIARLIEGKYTMVFLRRISREDYGNFADSDNIELKKVSNLVAQVLNLSDSPVVKSEWTYSYTVPYKDDIGLTIVIMSESEGPSFLEKFLKYKNIEWLKG